MLLHGVATLLMLLHGVATLRMLLHGVATCITNVTAWCGNVRTNICTNMLSIRKHHTSLDRPL